jgi:hypothetical protein
MSIEKLNSLPWRVFLDSSVLQTLLNYGEFIYENVEISDSDRIWSIPDGFENVEALRKICFVGQRAQIEFAISDNSLSEVVAKKDSRYLMWAFEMLDYWRTCLEQNLLKGCDANLVNAIEDRSFDYLSGKDRLLIRDAIFLECKAFMTMEKRMPKNKIHIRQKLNIEILNPTDYWKLLSPWAALFV